MDERLMKFSFTLGKDRKVEADLSRDLEIDTSSPEVIAQQLDKSPSIVYYWGSAYELAVVMETNSKHAFEKWYASVYEDVKKALIAEYGKTATTEGAIKNAIMNKYPEKMDEWHKEMTSSKYRKSMLGLAKEAFSRKHDALVNLLAYYRRLAENGG